VHLEEFAEGNSFIHRLDPRVKFFTILPFVFIIAFMRDIEGPLAALIISLVLAGLARLNLKKLLMRLLAVNVFIAFLWLFLPFSIPGEALFQIGFLTATREGVMHVLSITLKSNAIVIMTIAILGTSEVFTLAHALLHLKAPKKLVLLFFFFYRYITVLHTEYIKLKKAMQIRCFKPHSNMHTYRAFAYLIGMLIIRSFDRSNRIYNAMLCRGFKNNFPLASHFKLNKTDIAFFLGMIILMLLLVKTFGVVN
jgi:cobalt/nickel transport system permease protein